ncbi:MAG: NUDIX hydrolase [Thermodesulfobacteriota bacterium]
MSDREYPARPILGVAGVVFQGDAVLLARRAREPALGEWSLPGGVVELGESMAAALEREFLEEASVRIRVEGLVHLVERVIRDREGRIQYHYVIADYWGWLVQGRPEAASEVSEVRLVSVHRLGELVLHSDVIWVIQEALRLRRGDP